MSTSSKAAVQPSPPRLTQLGLVDPDTAARISEMAGRIARQFKPLQVTLFGSFARGDQRPDSDVDLLVVLPDVEDKRQSVIDISRALADIPLAKDVVVTTPSEIQDRGDLIGTILRPALREGKVLYRRRGWKLQPGMTDEERTDSARRWLRYASEDLLGAESMLEDVKSGRAMPRQACFWAQQSAEKALKAILIFEQLDFPRTHDVIELQELIPQDWRSVKELEELGTLSSWAVQARYPDALLEGTAAEAQTALAQARAVWGAVSAEFMARGIND